MLTCISYSCYLFSNYAGDKESDLSYVVMQCLQYIHHRFITYEEIDVTRDHNQWALLQNKSVMKPNCFAFFLFLVNPVLEWCCTEQKYFVTLY